ncbi:MAG TPA: penicillin-binding protein activator [Candidatus Binatia bacterium]|nr:penicillin-binding protein activator [Candidatus Binatia bacterium]
MKRSVLVLALLAGVAACRPQGINVPYGPSQRFRLAEDAFARGDYAAAAQTYREFIDTTAPDPAFLPRVYYQMALAQYRQQQYQATLASLDELHNRVPDRRWVQVQALRGDTELALGHRKEAAMAWESAWLVAQPAERGRIEVRLISVRDQLTDAERTEMAEVITIPPVRQALGLSGPPASGTASKAAAPTAPSPPEPAASAAPPAAAAPAVEDSTLEEAEPSGPGQEVVVTEASGEEAAPEPNVTIACLLPLTGPDNAYGKRALAGLRLAFADAPRQLVVRDTGGDPAIVSKLLTQLHDDAKVLAVIGPLRSSEAEAAAPLAERDGLPLLLLSQREGLSGRFVMQAAMTRSQQAERLASYAIDSVKRSKFGILYPNDGYGSAFAAAFKAAVTERGADVAGARAYTPGNPNLAELTSAAGRWHQSGVDALFIPDGAATAAAIAADIRKSIPNITLLGTESWNNQPKLADAGDSIDGAVFTDAFFADSARPSTRQFVERFERGAGRPPTVFEAQAFDAGMAVRQAINAGASSRDQMVDQLRNLGTFEGAGEMHASAAGFQRSLSLLRFHGGRVEEITD